MIAPLVELTLDYYRNPLAYGHLADGSFPLPRGFEQQFSLLCSALSPLHIETTARRLDTSTDELEAAARFFARHVLLGPSANHYRCLGVSARAPRSVVRAHYLFLIKLFHPDRLPNATETDLACSRRLNMAYHVLSDAGRRARYERDSPLQNQALRHSHPREFFEPHQVPLQPPTTPRRSAHPPNGWRWRLVVGIGCVLCIVGTLALWDAESIPLLRSGIPLATTQKPPMPYYLHGKDTRHGIEQETAKPLAGPKPGTAALKPTQDAETTPASAPGAAAIGSRIVDALQIALRRGDTVTLTQLFAAPRSSEPRLGRYLLLPKDPLRAGVGNKLWLTMEGMAWQYKPNGAISGHGEVAVSDGAGRDGGQTMLNGTVELELVPVDADYRIRVLRFHEH